MQYIHGSCPTIRCWLRCEHMHNGESHHGEVERCTISMVTSWAGRALGFDAVTERGARFTHLPLHAFVHGMNEQEAKAATTYELGALELWDCFSYSFDCMVDEFWAGHRVECRLRGVDKPVGGVALWMVAWAPDRRDTGCVSIPEEHKQAHIIQLDGGQYAALPNNRLRWLEPSFVTKPLPPEVARGYRTNHREWSVEAAWATEDSDAYFYEEQPAEPPLQAHARHTDGALRTSPFPTAAEDEPPACPAVCEGLQCELPGGHSQGFGLGRTHVRTTNGQRYTWRDGDERLTRAID